MMDYVPESPSFWKAIVHSAPITYIFIFAFTISHPSSQPFQLRLTRTEFRAAEWWEVMPLVEVDH